MNCGQEEECLKVLARLRGVTVDNLLVRIEFLEIKALRQFEILTAAKKYPDYQDGSFKSRFKIGFYDYLSLVTNRSLLKRTTVAVGFPLILTYGSELMGFKCLVMTFQQWNGINAVNYYAFVALATPLSHI